MSDDGSTSLIWRLVLRHAHFIVATGEAFKNRISAFNKNVQNEVPLTMLRVATLDEEIERRSAQTRNILYVGHLSETKGVLDLVKAVGIAKEKMKLDVAIDFVGGATSEEEASIRSLSHECGIETQLTLWGHIKDSELLRQRYTEADIFAFPSFYREGFPRVLYEAMMHGLPIITTKMPGIDGFLEDGRNCLHCQARNPLDIAKRIQQLVLNPTFGVRLGLAGHQQVADLFKTFHHHSHADQVMSLAANIFGDNASDLTRSKHLSH
jgi:glycosyltransferase involved in cell wall biosynthesis